MRYQDVTFTISPTGGHYSANLRFTCRTPGELANAKDAIVGCLDAIGTQWDEEERKNREMMKGE